MLTIAPIGDAEHLSREAAVLAGRLAQLLGDASIARDDAVAPGIAFLRSIAATPGIDETASFELRQRPIERLAAAFAMAQVEVDLIVLAGMAEEHEGFASLFRTLHPRGEPRPTAGLAAQLLCDSPSERVMLRNLLTTGSAVRSGAIALGDDGPFYERSLLLADSLWPALAGVDVWPARVRPLALDADDTGLEDWLGSARVGRAMTALRAGASALVLVVADDEITAVHRAIAMATHAGVPVVAVEYAANGGDEVQRLIALHAVVRGAAPAVRVVQQADGPMPDAPTFRDAPIPVVLCVRDGTFVVRGSRPVFTVRAERLPVRARSRLWITLLPELCNEAPLLAARYALEPHAVRDVAADVRGRAAVERRAPNVDDVAESVRARANLALAGGVRVVHPVASWDRLILSDDRRRQLREALDRLLHQGRVLDDWGFLAGRPGARGVRMLFAGPSGTGKTLAAEVLAHTIGVDLLVVDLARVVSKWIGETEKNLSDVFDTAERTQSVLLFDEADALFGKRTEVNDAHDRYANLETAYLLARLERFDGLAILSTNLRDNIDAAFTRRLEFVVDFDEPSVDERAAIWQCHIPATAPLAADVRIEELASLYPIVGGLIRNASVAAGFLASAADAPITRTNLVRAVQREYEKSGRAFPGAPAGTFTS
ncbi:MAG: AAA family ATPase [bacterium]